MKILLRPNLKKTDSLSCAREIIKRFCALAITPMLDEAARPVLNDPTCVYGPEDALMADCDMVMPIGGDGTVMRTAKRATMLGKPIIGINTGRVGFLTQLESAELENLALLKSGRYTICDRMLLEGVIHGERQSGEAFVCLNDIVVARSEKAGIVDIQVSAGGRVITNQRGDGIIFATPTGSTAYTLSAGGPVVDPGLELMVLTAICPHATFRHSLVLPMDTVYTVQEQIINRRNGLTVTADGRRVAVIGADDSLVIQKHAAPAKFVELDPHDFYASLSQKLSWH
ncbi:MAG: NAD(+)/NADH kinase [Oscillospiraceae bacterium]|jgi:NAD+ kinase|nr:NAD(+)/NADH kinase [Oscillospiraceae bacterium]